MFDWIKAFMYVSILVFLGFYMTNIYKENHTLVDEKIFNTYVTESNRQCVLKEVDSLRSVGTVIYLSDLKFLSNRCNKLVKQNFLNGENK